MQQSLLSPVGKLGLLERLDHWGNLLWIMGWVKLAKPQKTADYSMWKTFNLASLSKPQKTKESLRLVIFVWKLFLLCDSCPSSNSVFDHLNESSMDVLNAKITKKIENAFKQKLPNELPMESNNFKKQASTVPVKSEFEDNTEHYKIR